MGSIYRPSYRDRNGNLRESSVYWIQYFVGGKRERENTHTAKYDEAKNKLKTREGDVGSGKRTSASHGLLFRELLEDEVMDYQINHRHTLQDLRDRLDKHIIPYFGDYKPIAINPAEINKYIAKRQAEPGHRKGRLTTNGTINRELTAIGRAFSLAIESGKLSVMPKIKMLQENNVRTGFFERRQFEDTRKRLSEDLQDMVTFAYITGWRINSEVLPLQWPQVHFDADTVCLEPGTTKNDEGRTFPFTADLLAVLEARRAKMDALKQEGIICPWVFHREGAPIRYFTRAWKTACRLAGVPGRIPHDFRRTAVRNLVRAGIPESVAMQMTGHKTRSVFERYNITDEGDLFDAARKLDAHNSQSQQPKTGVSNLTQFAKVKE